MAYQNNCLIGFTFPIETEISGIQEILEDLCECGEVLKSSTVYKQYLQKDGRPFTANIRFVVQFSTYLSAEQSVYLLENNAKKGQPLLLAFNQQVVLSPKLTLPYPELIVDVLLLRCAAEIWGQYEHPVLQKTLGEIVKKSELKDRAEFLMQGESLIAF